MDQNGTFTAFAGYNLIASGDVQTMLRATKPRMDAASNETILIFDDKTGRQIDFDFRGTIDDVIARLASHPMFADKTTEDEGNRGPGRPKLGVVSREVTLLPRHWDWLEKQQGGMSAALRRLVDQARKQDAGAEKSRAVREAAGNFMWAIAGNLPGFEEASRALYAGNDEKLAELIGDWPTDIRKHLLGLLQ